MMIFLRVPSVPVAQPRQRHRAFATAGRISTQNYTPKDHPVTAFKAAVKLFASQAYRGPLMEGPILLELHFVFPRPGRLIWKTRPMPPVRHTSKPDLDNLEKSVKDALTGLIWKDDAQVCEVRKQKWYAAHGEKPCVEIRISEINGYEWKDEKAA